MRRKKSGWNIVLAGFWNRMIFTPDWVIPRLFLDPEVETHVALLPILPLVYQDSQTALEVTSAKLILRPRILADDAVLLRVEGMARKILVALPETPVQGVGINFAFTADASSGFVDVLLDCVDDSILESDGWSLEGRIITRTMRRGSDTLLTLAIGKHGDQTHFDFNFHANTTTAQSAIPLFADGHILRLRDVAVSVLDNVYDLTLDSGSDIKDEGDE